MKYWGLLIAKLGVLAFALKYVWMGIAALLPRPFLQNGRFLGYDLTWTLAFGLFFLLGCGALYIAILDQRYRCRVCVRRLRMPITAGSWGRMLLLGRPRIDYICPYGHGTLRVPDLQISGIEAASWRQHEDMWQELYSLDERR